MIINMLSLASLKAYRNFVAVAGILLCSACSTQNTQSGVTDTMLPGIVVLGATQKSGLNTPVDATRMSIDLASLLAGRGDLKITPSNSARSIIGPAPHDEMMAYYARHARFAPYQVQRLMAANLPSPRALAVRLEADRIDRLPVIKANIVNAEGFLLADQEQHTYVTRRTTQLSATLLDLRNGRVIWTRQYRVAPESVSTANHRLGDSVGASIAAVMANTLLNGVGEKSHPAPPLIIDSVSALLQEVAYNIPIQ